MDDPRTAPEHTDGGGNKFEDFSSEKEPPTPVTQGALLVTKPYNPDETRETTRGDLARGLLWLLTFAIGGVIAFIGLGRLDGTVLTQSIFPSLVALAGTALGFYFGSQTAKDSVKEQDSSAGTNGASGSNATAGTGSNVKPGTAGKGN